MRLAAWQLLLTPSPAEPTSDMVRWQAPRECPSAGEFAARVDELRGDATLGVSFDFTITRTRGRLELRDAGHEARYTARRCEALVDTALLLVSLVLVPTGDPGDEVDVGPPPRAAALPATAGLASRHPQRRAGRRSRAARRPNRGA